MVTKNDQLLPLGVVQLDNAPILLVHGACHRSDCWHMLSVELRALGREVHSIDLPGYGRDTVGDPVSKTLDDGIEATVAALKRQSRPALLVGHSLGGMTVSGAAERAPEAVAGIVYLCAVVPYDGQCAADVDAGTQDLHAASYILEDGARVGIHHDHARAVFYNDCDDRVSHTAIASLVPTDLTILTSRLTLTESHFGAVRKHYIHCLSDNAIGIAAQRAFSSRYAHIEAHNIDASHSPFLSKPAELAALLASL